MFWPKNDWKSSFWPKKRPQITLFQPKIWHFKKTTLYDLTELFPKFGIPMSTNDLMNVPLEVDSVIHKAVVDVDEEGTTAAAATAVMMSRAMVMVSKPEEPFHVDREFLYAIYDTKNKRVLFSGSFVEPEFVWKVEYDWKKVKNAEKSENAKKSEKCTKKSEKCQKELFFGMVK